MGRGPGRTHLFGLGKEVKFSHRSSIDRDENFFSYIDPNLAGSRARLGAVYADATDGYRHELAVERPFYAVDTRWSVGGSLHDEERIDKMYDLGEVVDRFHHALRASTVQGGWSRGSIEGRAQRWLLGVTTEEDSFEPTLATPDAPQTMLLPADRKLVYPWLGWQRIEDDYREMSERRHGQDGRHLARLESLFQRRFRQEELRVDRDAMLFKASAQSGWDLGAGRMLLLDTGGSTRNEDDGLHNSQMYAGARYYQRNLEKNLFSVSLSALVGSNLDSEEQVLLGGDTGLRGYPVRYQAGEQRVLLTVEERFFTDFYPWRLVRVGYAVFADAGRFADRIPARHRA